jgi:hypothetical protein
MTKIMMVALLGLGIFAHADSLTTEDIKKLTSLKFVSGVYTDSEGKSAKITECAVNFYPLDKYRKAPSIALEYYSALTPSAGAVGAYFNISENAPDRDYAHIFYKTSIRKSGDQFSIMQNLNEHSRSFQVEATESGYRITSTWVSSGSQISTATQSCEFSE